jgi:hypothetical protein
LLLDFASHAGDILIHPTSYILVILSLLEIEKLSFSFGVM